MLWKIIRERMENFPDATVKEGEIRYTYSDLIAAVNDFSKRLDGCPCCAVLCDTDIFTGAALLSCFAAGVTAVPLSYRYGEKHIKKTLDLITPPYIICERNGSLELISTGAKGYGVDSCTSAAVIMSTSGTTGEPKGVMLSEGNLICNISDIDDYFDIKQGDNILISRPLYHCAVLTGEFLFSLYKGVNIYFDDGIFSPSRLVDIIASERINVFCGTPTMLSIVCDMAKRKGCNRMIERIALSGECLNQMTAEKLKQGLPCASIYHVYGLTEASPRVSFLSPERFGEDSLCVGKPLRSVSIMIADKDGLPVLDGTKGEVLIKGRSVMEGYYKNEALTKKALRNGWLHTGDEGYINCDGMLCICGRIDDMIIRAGMNIYPSEIENELLKDSRIKSAVASGYKDKNGIERIALTICGDIDNKSEVFEICKKALPEYMQPSRIELRDDVPLGVTGKAERRQQK